MGNGAGMLAPNIFWGKLHVEHRGLNVSNVPSNASKRGNDMPARTISVPNVCLLFRMRNCRHYSASPTITQWLKTFRV